MSGGSDKTEKPTPHRIQKAREEGQVAKSQDFNGALVLSAATMLLMSLGPGIGAGFYTYLVETFEDLNHYVREPITVSTFPDLLQNIVLTILWTLVPILVSLMVVGILANLIQVRPLFAAKAIMPKWEKINPLSGFKRMFSPRSAIEVIKGIVKMCIIGGATYAIINSHLQEMLGLSQTDLESGWTQNLEILKSIALWSSTLFFVLGIIDWRYQAWELEKQLRMTKQEIKDEHKNQEGDPMVKNRIRQMGMKMARDSQIAEVPTADVIITNPTHFAIAIKYDPDIAPAPTIIAKGVDHFALKIREVGKENNVPTVENVPLARSLYKMAEVGQMIPPDMFVAVAEVLAYVYAKNKGRKMHGRIGGKPADNNTGVSQ